MGKFTAKQVQVHAMGKTERFADGDGLYFVVPKSGKVFGMLRFTSINKRKEIRQASIQSCLLQM